MGFGCSIRFGSQLAKGRTSGRNGGREQRAFARRSCGPLLFLSGTANSAFKIQDSKFKIKRGLRTCLGIYSASGRRLRSARKFGNELRASAAPGCGPPIPAGSISLAGSPWHCFGSSGRQPAAADFRRDILQQTRLRSSRQPAAAPGRRAAISRCSKAGPSARLRAGLAAGPTAKEVEPLPARSDRTEPQPETCPSAWLRAGLVAGLTAKEAEPPPARS